MYVSVIGGGKCNSDIYDMAVEVGRRIARMNAIVVTGGLSGVMEAVCRGAKEEGGTTIGILPDETRRRGNAYLDYIIATGLGQARNVLVALNGDIIIAIDGGYGTLSEIALALKFKKKVYGLRACDVGLQNYENVEELFNAIDHSESSS
jgi:uncharacterized protein (TIGR00725 family)